jgi:tRNA A37 threonylcarbamoyltransferase TsaD
MPKTPRKKNKIEAPPIRILGIETSCDETAASVVEDGRLIISRGSIQATYKNHLSSH